MTDATILEPGKLADRFIFPPFTVFNANGTPWRARKAKWLDLDMDSGDGRDDDLTYGIPMDGDAQTLKNKYEESIGRKTTWAEFTEAHSHMAMKTTSIFDPNLADILVNWFCPVGGTVIDPFSGGVVRGAVAAMVGRNYIGIDLSARQIEANRAQWAKMKRVGCTGIEPKWINDDGVNIAEHVTDKADMIMSCPPYHDLEIYSESPNDLSNMSYDAFIAAYRKIIAESINCSKDDAFAAFVVGDIRHGKNGTYRNFVGHTIDAFIDGGMELYNKAILFTAIGSLAVRTGGSFDATRKMGKAHQNVLIFSKGDPRVAARRCIEGGVVDVFADDRVAALDDMFI